MPPNDPQVALEEKRATLAAIPADQVKKPPYPPDAMVGEGNALYKVAVRYKSELAEVNLDVSLIDDLPKRTQALAGAQAARALVPDTKRSAAELATESEVYEVRNELLSAGRYATRTNTQAQSALDKVSEGTGDDDAIQDLRDLALFGETYAQDMKCVGLAVDETVSRARELASKYENLLAERRTVSDAEQGATDVRDRAATHQWEAVSEIRAAGSYRFRKDPAILPLFQSSYRRRHRGGKKG